MSWFSTHVYDAGHVTNDTKGLVAETLSATVKYSTFGLYDEAFTWDDGGFTAFGSKAGMNIYGGSLGQGLYAFGNLMTRDFTNFLKYPADSLSPNEEGDGTLNKWRQDWRKQWGDWKEKMMEMAPGGNIPSAGATAAEEEEAYSIKGPGKMRGRDPLMAFNKGVKGFGRGSLKIGKGGVGDSRIGGKFKTWRTGRWTDPN
jgi:hypothetical protein